MFSPDSNIIRLENDIWYVGWFLPRPLLVLEQDTSTAEPVPMLGCLSRKKKEIKQGT